MDSFCHITCNASMIPHFPASCFCDAVQFKLTAKPMFINCCHCRDCQIQTGGRLRSMGLSRRSMSASPRASPCASPCRRSPGGRTTSLAAPNARPRCGATLLIYRATRLGSAQGDALRAHRDPERRAPLFARCAHLHALQAALRSDRAVGE